MHDPLDAPGHLRARVVRHGSQIERLFATQGELVERQKGHGERIELLGRLTQRVDAIAMRQTADGQLYAGRDSLWALEKRIKAIEKRDRSRELIALAAFGLLLVWAGLLTLTFILAVGAR